MVAFDKSEFLATFRDESNEHIENLNNGLLNLEKDPENQELIEEMFREAHTLKGAARMMGFDEIKDIAHVIEDIFEKIVSKQIKLTTDISTHIFSSLDHVSTAVEEVVGGLSVSIDTPSVIKDLEDILKKSLEGSVSSSDSEDEKKKTAKPVKEDIQPEEKVEIQAIDDVSIDESAEEEDSDEFGDDYLAPDEAPTIEQVKAELEAQKVKSEKKKQQSEQSQTLTSSSSTQTKQVATKPKREKQEVEEYIRVPLHKINKLLNLVGEMVINKIKSSQKVAILKRLSKLIKTTQKDFNEISQTVLTNSHFQALHTFNDIKNILQECNVNFHKMREESNDLFDYVSAEVSQLDPIIDELQLRMKEIRMLPVSTIFSAMPRLVRDIAVSQQKDIDLIIEGEETELDKKVLESIKGPLIHLLRNSVDHGIEMPDDRESTGKDRMGTIKLSAFHKGGNVIIEIKDDGKGFDLERIKETALRKGLSTQKELEAMSEREITNFVFMSGFSTAKIITDVSGRGVGLDVVKTDIEKLKGNIVIDTQKNIGTTFSLQLPLTIAIIQALLIRCNKEIFAIPILSIDESISVKKNEIYSIENREAIRVREKTISVVRMTEILDLPDTGEARVIQQNKKNKDLIPVVIVSLMDKLVGFMVDEIIGEQEIFIKSLGDHIGKLPNISGATVLGNGKVIAILDVVDLVNSAKVSHPSFRRVKEKTEKKSHDKKRILIAEDSLTTRELERSILESEGYFVETAMDGIDALNKVSQEVFDVIISDIEMPRMNGFELCKAIKQNSDTKDIPVIIVTSLDKEEDKRRGIEVGAQAYIVKSTFDQSNLIDAIERLIG
ncbi:MAG: hybrid sensor histidine kinase/response regulator [Candidatus Aureabacteria bacterium]|nr:hybrid sensor histidine kinase/response regulator [Candidatus Auribacterota bacterium]